jgi:hypothetical protein
VVLVRRALAVVLSVLLTSGSVLLAMLDAPAATAAAAKPGTERTVTVPIEVWTASAAQTPGGRLDYWAVAGFVTFAELPGWVPARVDYAYTSRAGVRSAESDLLQAPYDDMWSWGPLARTAPAGQHLEMLGDQPSVWRAGSGDCTDAYAVTSAGYGPNPMATVTYLRSPACTSALNGKDAATKALKRARKALDRATTAQATAKAAGKVQKAQRTLAKAKKAAKKRC